MKFPRSSNNRLCVSCGRNGTPWVKPVEHTTSSARSTVPSLSSAEGPSAAANRRVMVTSRWTLMLPASTPSKKPSVASPMAPRTMSSI